MSNRYIAIVTATIRVEFEDDGDLDLVDQAHGEASALFDEKVLLDLDVREITPSDDEGIPK